MSVEQARLRSRRAWRIRLAPWQWVLILSLSVPLAALLSYLTYAVSTRGAPTLGTGFVLTHDVPAGYTLGSGDYKPMPLSYATSTIAYLTKSPAGRVVAVPLGANALLSDGELLPPGATLKRVAINLTDPPPIAPNEQLDLWLAYGNSQVRVGADIPVDSVDPLTIRVASDDAPYWISLVQSKLPMYAVVTTDTTDTKPLTVGLCAALKKLGGVDCSTTGPSTPGPG